MPFLFAVTVLSAIATISGQRRMVALEDQPGRPDPAAADDRSNRMKGSVRIVALGDSITNGVGLASATAAAW